MTHKPLVSIGMPAYNAGPYIEQSIESVLAQTYHHFELIISDNASTDNTPEICRRYLKDSRVQYHRNETNIGGCANFNRVFELAQGQYFMWAADHDLWHPNFVSACVAILEANPEVVLAYAQTLLIDSRGEPLELMSDRLDTRGMADIQRYRHLVWKLHGGNMIYGVIRSQALAQTPGFRHMWGVDNILLTELALLGAFAQIPEPMFYRRQNRAEEDPETRKKRMLFYIDPTTAAEQGQKRFDELYLDFGKVHLQLVAQSSLSTWEKLQAYLVTILSFRIRFKVRWPGLRLIEQLVTPFIPKRLHWRMVSLTLRLIGQRK